MVTGNVGIVEHSLSGWCRQRKEAALNFTSNKKVIFRRKSKMLGKLTNTSDVTIASEDETSKFLQSVSLTRIVLAKPATQTTLIPFATIIVPRTCVQP